MGKETHEFKCKWTFAKLKGNELGKSVNDASIAHFDKSPYPSLIRESIQNSLDASDGSGNPVVVEYSFHRIQSSLYPEFFELEKHINGCANLFDYNENVVKMSERMVEVFRNRKMKTGQIHYIKISDKNTKGMPFKKMGEGKSPFSSFLRISGDSLKNDAGSGGSFGFGKAAYFNISPIRTVLVSTITSENECFFEGGAMLTDHRYNDDIYSSFGFYDDKDGYEPTSKIENIPLDFRRTEVGTDFYIMGVDGSSSSSKEKAVKEMIEATLRNFWLAIHHNKLKVKVENVDINKDTLPDLMNEYFDSDRDDKNRSINYNPRPYYEAVKNSGKNTSHIHISKEIPVLGEVSLFIKKVKDAKDKVAYMRSPRMLVFSKQFQTSYGCYCLFFCDNKIGNEILRNLENAAHREWDPSNYKDNIKIGKDAMDSIVSFISESFEKLFDSGDDVSLGISGLEEYLYLDDDLLPTEDEDIKDNPFLGNPSGDFDFEGTSMTSVIDNDKHRSKEPKRERIGQVVAVVNTKAKSDPNGELGGNDKHPASDKHNQRPAPGDKPKMESEDGQEGSYRAFVPVKYRVIATKTLQGDINHTLIIYSPYDVKEAMIELLIAGEQDSEALDITYSDKGDFNENQVFDLSFKQGKNQVTVRFDDNMKHPIILKAYESR